MNLADCNMNHLPDYIDIHTHQPQHDPAVRAVHSKYENFDRLEQGNHYSLGIHPWYIADAAVQLHQLALAIGNTAVLAIGECGLDYYCKTDRALQQEVFTWQIQLANQYRKPLIIHCVKAFPETLSMLQAATVPVVFHGFHKKQSVARDILNQGYYLSFGATLLHADPLTASVFASVPDDRFLLETDDRAGLDIREIYKAASFIRKTGKEAIILQLQKNFQKVLHT